MWRVLIAVLVVSGLGMGLDLGASRSGLASARGTDAPRVVVHVNFAEPGQQGRGLKNLTNILKETRGAGTIEVVCHGPGIGLVETARTEHADRVAELIAQGVGFVACENTMRDKSIRREDLLPGVGTVPAGALEVIRKQQEGYAYFKP